LRWSSRSPSSAHSATSPDEAEAEGIVIVDYFQRDPRLVGLSLGPALGERAGLVDPAAPAAVAAANDQPLDPRALGGDCLSRRLLAGAQGRDRARQPVLGLRGKRKPSVGISCKPLQRRKAHVAVGFWSRHAAVRYHAMMHLTTKSTSGRESRENGHGHARATASSRGPRALEPRFYLAPEVLDRELHTIFSRTWQYAGHVGDLPEPGRYLTATAGDQPVLVLRGDDGEVRAFRNVCRHRGSQLLTGSGRCKKAIRCRYHGWTYDATDGRLLGVPEHRSYTELDKSGLGLMPARVETLAGLLFVNLDPDAVPLASETGELAERLSRYRLPELRRFSDFGETSQPANWKLVAENYLEGYHVPIAHPALMRLYDYKRYSFELHDTWAWFEAPLRDSPSGNRLERLYQRVVRPMPGLEAVDRNVWRYAFIYPNTTIDLHPDQVTVWQMVPAAPGRTRDVWGCFGPNRRGPLTRLAQRLNTHVNSGVLDEDIDLVAAVQRGIRTHGYEPGPLAAKEAAVGWFADRIRDDLGELEEAAA
jgi:choline monooxygenase